MDPLPLGMVDDESADVCSDDGWCLKTISSQLRNSALDAVRECPIGCHQNLAFDMSCKVPGYDLVSLTFSLNDGNWIQCYYYSSLYFYIMFIL